MYPKNYEGYNHWQQFITKDYYEFHQVKDKTVYEVCQCKDPDQNQSLSRQIQGTSPAELIAKYQAR